MSPKRDRQPEHQRDAIRARPRAGFVVLALALLSGCFLFPEDAPEPVEPAADELVPAPELVDIPEIPVAPPPVPEPAPAPAPEPAPVPVPQPAAPAAAPAPRPEPAPAPIPAAEPEPVLAAEPEPEPTPPPVQEVPFEEPVVETVPEIFPEAPPEPEESPEDEATGETVAYVDTYLLDDTVPAFIEPESVAVQPYGKRNLDIELGYYSSDDDFLGDDTERGARLRFNRETANWGSIDLDASFVSADSDYLGRETMGDSGTVTLRQSAMVINSGTMLDTTIGHQRASTSSLLHGGYRMRLPVSTVLGLDANLESAANTLRFSTGETGSYRGMHTPRFEDNGGRLTTVGFERPVGARFDVGAEVADVSGDDDIRDHTSLLVGTRFVSDDDTQEHGFNLLADDSGEIGFWSDSRHELQGRTVLRYGGFVLDTDVTWADLPIMSDQQGVYLRADTSNARFSLHGGYDFLETGLAADALTNSSSHSLFFAGSLNLRRSLSIGLNTRLAGRKFEAATSDNQTISRINAYARMSNLHGSLRLELFSDRLDSEIVSSDRRRNGVATSFDWQLPERIRLTTELRLERDSDGLGDTRTSELSALFRYELFERVSLGFNASLYRTRGELYSASSGVGLSADASWQFLRHWRGQLTLSQNQADYEIDDQLFLPYAVRGESGTRSLWLSVRYQRQRGRAYPMAGLASSGQNGSGRIRGQVFYDENRDSIRQPSERPVAGAIVLLDGRFEARTDAQGFYSFEAVPVGDHELRLLTERLPLPWGLDDERPRQVSVELRREAALDFALIIMD